MRTRVSATSALTLVLGFGVASLTGNRALGGIVLLLGGAMCAWWMTRQAGPARTLAALAAVVTLFVLSHPLGSLIGAWPAVLLVSAIAGGLTFALARPSDTASTTV